MTLTIALNDINELNKKAADIILKSITKLLLSQKKVVLAVPGGRSVVGIFNLLKEKDIPWKKVHIFMVDERLVPLNDPRSNFKLAEENFIGELMNKGLLLQENVHSFLMDLGTSYYEAELRKYNGRYDIVLLSSGEDGHVAGLYPNHHSIRNNSDFFISMSDSPKPPEDRMSASRKLLMKSKVAILLFFGEIKMGAYRKFLDDNIDVDSCPAKLVLSVNDSYVLTDLNLKGKNEKS